MKSIEPDPSNQEITCSYCGKNAEYSTGPVPGFTAPLCLCCSSAMLILCGHGHGDAYEALRGYTRCCLCHGMMPLNLGMDAYCEGCKAVASK